MRKFLIEKYIFWVITFLYCDDNLNKCTSCGNILSTEGVFICIIDPVVVNVCISPFFVRVCTDPIKRFNILSIRFGWWNLVGENVLNILAWFFAFSSTIAYIVRNDFQGVSICLVSSCSAICIIEVIWGAHCNQINGFACIFYCCWIHNSISLNFVVVPKTISICCADGC